jgi:drug/metabolite transporter (DMT)-like permease
MTERGRASTYGKLVLMAMFWGGAFIGTRVATSEMTPPAAALWRYVVATSALVAWALLIEGALAPLSSRQWIAVCLMGLTGVALFNIFFMFGLARVPASRGSLIMALNPAITLLGAVLFLHDRLTRDKVLGVVIALVGVSVVLARGNPLGLFQGHVGPGELLLLVCPVAWAAYTLIGKKMLGDLSPLAATAYAALIGTAMLAVFAAATGDLAVPHASLRSWLAMLFVGLFGTAVAFVWFYEGVRRIGPARTSVFINLVPVFAVVLGVLLLGEPLEISMLVGGALVIVGVLLLNRAPPAPSAAGHPR